MRSVVAFSAQPLNIEPILFCVSIVMMGIYSSFNSTFRTIRWSCNNSPCYEVRKKFSCCFFLPFRVSEYNSLHSRFFNSRPSNPSRFDATRIDCSDPGRFMFFRPASFYLTRSFRISFSPFFITKINDFFVVNVMLFALLKNSLAIFQIPRSFIAHIIGHNEGIIQWMISSIKFPPTYSTR